VPTRHTGGVCRVPRNRGTGTCRWYPWEAFPVRAVLGAARGRL